MKILRGFANVIIGITLFALIFAVSFTTTTKGFIENDLLQETIKHAMDEASKNDSNVEQYKDVIDDMFDDGNVSSIVNMVLDNYHDYKKNGVVNVSKDDAKKLYDFVLKYKDKIKEISGQDVSKMSEKEFEEYFDQAKVNEIARDAFTELDKNIDGDGVETALNVYVGVMSNSTKTILICAIVGCIALLALINWSFIRWMLTTGVCTLISGVLMTIIYFVINIFKNDILKDVLKVETDINFSKYLVIGIIELIIGIGLIVAYVILKKTVCRNKKVVTKTKVVYYETNYQPQMPNNYVNNQQPMNGNQQLSTNEKPSVENNTNQVNEEVKEEPKDETGNENK